ncbi:MAG: hypothetical protein HC913_06705 [Microscillaceae bacterium]|nr:hypothetical protein [Microscillaceae bacterium]
MTTNVSLAGVSAPLQLFTNFSPNPKGMNGSNGLVCHNGFYHLFFQYNSHNIVSIHLFKNMFWYSYFSYFVLCKNKYVLFIIFNVKPPSDAGFFASAKNGCPVFLKK